MHKQTLGQYRVGVDFNPSGNLAVVRIKEKAAALIDEIDSIPVNDGEIARLRAHAMTLVEDAAMNAVKAATKPARG